MTRTNDPAADALPTWPGQKKCRYCRTPLTRLQSGIGRCDSRICVTSHQNESHRLRYRLVWNDHVANQRAGVAAHGPEIVAGTRALDTPADRLNVGIVPRIDRPLEAVPRYRHDALIAHVREIVAQAFERPDPGPLPPHRSRNEAPETAVATAACIACRGHCCVLGMVANAFLRVETIDHVRRHHPDLGPDEIVAGYEDRVPALTVKDSCLFQGAAGCTLDRTWRADMCNNFQCNGKRQALERAAGAGEMLWIATEDGEGRAVVHDGAGTRPVAVDAAAGDTDPGRVGAAIAAVRARLPEQLRETAPVHATACRRCGMPIDPVRAAAGLPCGSAACDLAGRH